MSNSDVVIGILGGMGPLAGAEFLRLVIQATAAPVERDHFRTVLYSDPKIPSRYAASCGTGPSPAASLQEGIDRLSAFGASFVAVACNAAHVFRPEIAGTSRMLWLDMIAVVGEAVRASSHCPVVLGAVVIRESRVYERELPGVRHIAGAGAELTDVLIEAIKSGDDTEQLELDLARAILAMRPLPDALLLGCTELSLARNLQRATGLAVFDSSQIYARGVVAHARTLAARGSRP